MSNQQKPYHHGNLQAELLRLATEIGRAEGPEAITIRAVTRAAGVSPTSAYRHYKDQSQLLAAVANVAAEELIERLRIAITAKPAGTPAIERLHAAGHAYFRFGMEQAPFFRCMLASPLLSVDSDNSFDYQKMLTSPQSALLKTLRELLCEHADCTDQTHVQRSLLPNLIACWSAIHGYTMLCTQGHLAGLPEESKYDGAQAVIASALRGIDFNNPHSHGKSTAAADASALAKVG